MYRDLKMIAIISLVVGVISVVLMVAFGQRDRKAKEKGIETDLVDLHGQNVVKVREIIGRLEQHIQQNESGSEPFMDGLTFDEARVMMEKQEKDLIALRPTIIQHGKDLPPKVRRRNIQLLKDNLNQADYINLHIK